MTSKSVSVREATDLRRFADAVLEDRAVFAALRQLHWDGHVVERISRPDREPTGGAHGRWVDGLALVDGIATAIEVVTQLRPDEAPANRRVRVIERLMQDLAPGVLTGEAWAGSSLGVHVTYDETLVLELGRKQLRGAASALLDEAAVATLSETPGTTLDLPVTGHAWIRAAAAFRLKTERSRVFLVSSPGVRNLTTDTQAWVRWVIERKGDQHIGIADRAVLVVVTGPLIEAEELEQAFASVADLPWWRIYAAPLGVDSVTMVSDRVTFADAD